MLQDCEDELRAVKEELERVRGALQERIEMACRKACGWEHRVEGASILHTRLHSPECESARAALAASNKTTLQEDQHDY